MQVAAPIERWMSPHQRHRSTRLDGRFPAHVVVGQLARVVASKYSHLSRLSTLASGSTWAVGVRGSITSGIESIALICAGLTPAKLRSLRAQSTVITASREVMLAPNNAAIGSESLSRGLAKAQTTTSRCVPRSLGRRAVGMRVRPLVA